VAILRNFMSGHCIPKIDFSPGPETLAQARVDSPKVDNHLHFFGHRVDLRSTDSRGGCPHKKENFTS
jgi:hypothetical protein